MGLAPIPPSQATPTPSGPPSATPLHIVVPSVATISCVPSGVDLLYIVVGVGMVLWASACVVVALVLFFFDFWLWFYLVGGWG